MATIRFYLLGGTASDGIDIEIQQTTDFEEAQNIVASQFAIVEPKGIN